MYARIIPVLTGILLPFLLMGQQMVRGTVTEKSPEGEPLIGVNVVVGGEESTGTITDLDGNFELNVPANATTLIFSYIGYQTKEVPLDGRARVDVVLVPEAELLDEVIISAFGVAKEKKSLGYAAQDLGGEELVNARETNLVSALSGKVAGVQVTSTSGNPGASANIVIRGRTSFSGNNAPLFIVDGVPIDNSYAGSNFTDQSNRAIDINPNDIEQITVLKGTAATALYGMRAGNGAIIITTKRGKADNQTHVSFSTSLTLDQVNKLPGKQQLYAQGVGGDYIDPLSGSPSSWGPRIDTLRYADDPDYSYSKIGRIVGQSHPLASDRRVSAFPNSDAFFQTGLTSNSNLVVDGGGEVANYLISMGFLQQTGIIPNSDFNRINLKVGGAVKPAKSLRVSAAATYSLSGGMRQQRGSNLSGVMLGLMRTPPTFDLTNGSDDPVNDPSAYQLPNGDQRKYNASYDNPYWSVNKNLVEDQVNRIIGYTQLDWDIAKGLRVMYRVGMDVYFEERKSYWDGRSGEFSSINGLLINDLFSFRSINSDAVLTYERTLGNDWSLDLLGGHNYYEERSYNVIQEGENFIIPDFYDMSNVQNIALADDNLERLKIMGLFYEARLGFRNYLYLSTTGRNDASSTLPADNNSFFYPSFSLGFVFTEPLGLATNSIFSYGKVRASYGIVGNDAPGPYLLNINYVPVGQIQGQTSFLRSTSIGNANLEPERSSSLEFGLELRFLQGRLGLDATYYQNVSDRQILQIPVAYSSGFTTLVGNAGKVENQGIEFLLDAQPVQRGDFAWDIQLNFSANENTVVSVFENIELINLPGSGVTSTRNVILANEPYGVIFGTRWLRDDSGAILIDDNGYPIMDQDRGVVGDPNPDWLMGIRNTFSWKGLQLSLLLDIRQGGDIFNGTRGVMSNLGIHADTETRTEEVVVEGVKASDGTPNDIPIRLDEDYYSLYPFAGVSEASIEDGSFIRLREVTLLYSLPPSWLSKLPFSDAQLGLSGRNLWLQTDYSGIDPETNLSGASNSFGRDYFNSPNTRSMGINLSCKF